MRIFIACAAMFLANLACAQQLPMCPPAEGVTVQVLGSGGPIADDARASSAYLVWVDGRARALVDAGGGSLLRFAESGAAFGDLDFVGLSHFHADHSADFMPLLKSGYFGNRERPLVVAGPGGNGRFPGLHEFLEANLDPDDGAFRYLSGYLDGSGGRPKLEPFEIGDESVAGENLLADFDSEVSVLARPVPHGIVPATGFRVSVRGRSIVFASDQNGSDPEFAEFARSADLLVMHMPIPEGAPEAAKQLHAEPSRIADVASTADVDRLLLSHFMARSLGTFDDNLRIVRDGYDGDVLVATDLQCVPLD